MPPIRALGQHSAQVSAPTMVTAHRDTHVTHAGVWGCKVCEAPPSGGGFSGCLHPGIGGNYQGLTEARTPPWGLQLHDPLASQWPCHPIPSFCGLGGQQVDLGGTDHQTRALGRPEGLNRGDKLESLKSDPVPSLPQMASLSWQEVVRGWLRGGGAPWGHSGVCAKRCQAVSSVSRTDRCTSCALCFLLPADYAK